MTRVDGSRWPWWRSSVDSSSLEQANALIGDRGAVELHVVLGQVHECFLEGGLLSRQLEQGDAGVAGGQPDLVGAQTSHVQRVARSNDDAGIGPSQDRGEGAWVGGTNPHQVSGGAGDELIHAGVGDQASEPNDDQMLGGLS